MLRGAVRTAGIAMACIVVAACGGQGATHTGASTAPATTATQPPSTQPTSTLGTSSAGATTPNSQTAASRCTTAQLTLALHGIAGLGHGGYVLSFRNHGSACTLYGYPGVDGLDKHGRVVVSARRTPRGYLGGLGQGATEKLVLLTSGQSASAVLEGLNAPRPSQPCHHYSSLAITPPNETHAMHVSAAASICYPQIHPVVPGTTGQQP